MRISRIPHLFFILLVSLLLPASAIAAPGGNSANAHACQKGGWEQLQGTDGTRFSNQGECVSYGAHGGTLESLPMLQLTLFGGTDVYDGGVSGSGFTPGSTVTVISWNYDGTDVPFVYDVPVQSDGTFSTSGHYRWCNAFDGRGFTSITFIAESPVDGTYSQTFDLVSYCA